MMRLGFSEEEWEAADHWYDGKADRIAEREERRKMTTIEERLSDWDKYPASQWASDAIVADWNAAIEAMKAARSAMQHMDNFKPYPYCANPFASIIADLSRNIARMEGKTE